MTTIGNVLYRKPARIPPYTRLVPHPILAGWPGHERARVVAPDVAGAIIDLPKRATVGRDYEGLAWDADNKGAVTLWQLGKGRARRVWRALSF